ncbi:Rad52/Rad22 family DNA repair protein [Butyrivibrio proteoclasticus]|uniref:Rad52/Rad22 family DNA repair protein n=1 Tax=Butyrivibrio proteoclasticus TaxID=43305 RepID=UPI00047C2330|nr:Rad52/Rad22 family DNA repair protein [Butyrivibrio proteoclasticus]
MSSTVNGKPLAEVLASLRKVKYPAAKKGKYDYFKIDEYISVFDEIVGIANYLVDYTDFSYSKITTSQEQYTVKCRISILSDDGKVVLYRESYGGYTCQYEKNTGKDTNLSNSSNFACHAAFKNAAKRFGIFGAYCGGNNENSDVFSKEPDETSRNQNKKNSVINFVTDGKFEVIDTKDDRPVYKLNAYEIVGDVCRDSISQIIFYPNMYSKDAKKMNGYITKCCNSRTRMRIKVQCVAERNSVKQYVFKSFERAA